VAKGKGKGPGENRAIHNAADLAADAIKQVLGSVYRVACSADHETLYNMIQSAERMRVVIDQMAALATGKTVGRIEQLSAESSGKIGEVISGLIEAGHLPPPPPGMQ
jgi:hypothetical protein